MASLDVAVVGSLNQDLTIRVPRHPGPSETVLGTNHYTGAGGKGANQAAAAARLGRTVAMIGKVGDDASGRFLLVSLQRAGVDTSKISIDTEHATGMAIITVDDDAENTIVVSPGANRHLSPVAIHAAEEILRAAAVTLVQLEIPLDTVEAALTLAEGLTILNPAPATVLPAELSAELAAGFMQRIDVLVPNRSEQALMTGSKIARMPSQASAQARMLCGPKAVVVTLGSDGALLVQDGKTTHVAAPRLTPVDTTGAGDAFCGALADALARGRSLPDAIRWAVCAGACAVTRPGALDSLPDADAVLALMDGDR